MLACSKQFLIGGSCIHIRLCGFTADKFIDLLFDIVLNTNFERSVNNCNNNIRTNNNKGVEKNRWKPAHDPEEHAGISFDLFAERLMEADNLDGTRATTRNTWTRVGTV